VDAAGDVAERIFDEEDANLQEVRDQSQEFKEELDQKSEVSERNLGRVSDATAPLEGREVIDEAREIKEGFLEDLEMLREFRDRVAEVLDRDEEVRAELHRVREGGEQ